MSMKAANRKIPETAKELGQFLEEELPMQAVATLTTRTQVSLTKFDSLILEWLRGMQAHNHRTIGTIKAYEYGIQRHAHLALISTGPLDCTHAENLWRTLAAPGYKQAAVVKPFVNGMSGLPYILKTVNSSVDEVAFSDNLTGFVKGGSQFGTNSAQSRKRMRIQSQASPHSHGGSLPLPKPESPTMKPRPEAPAWNGGESERQSALREFIREDGFLRAKFQLRAFASLATNRPLSQAVFDDFSRTFIRGLRGRNRIRVGWVKACWYERHSRVYIARIAIIAPRPIDYSHAERLWRANAEWRDSDISRVTPHHGLCRLSYIMSQLQANSSDMEFCENLPTFAIADRTKPHRSYRGLPILRN